MTQTPSNVKNELRQRVVRLKVSDQVRQVRSFKIATQIERSIFFRRAKTIGFYAAMKDEVDVSLVAQKALDSGKKLFFPRINRNKIEFREVRDLNKDLASGKFGVLEPVIKTTKKRVSSVDLILIPGRAFDKKGWRLGRGGGHYDRLLGKWKRSFRMGIAFREQMMTAIPFESHDIKMDIVLSA